MKRQALIIFVLLIAIISCKKRSYNPEDISGTWYYIFNDSTYGEVIFTKTIFWEYTEQVGTFGGRYKIENDSFKIDFNRINRKFTRISIDEFINTSNSLTTKYYRLNIPIDTVGLLRDDVKTLDKYFNDWRERKYNWEKEFREKNSSL